MSMADRSEGQMTELVDKVAEQIVGEVQWAETPLFAKYKFKEAALPMLDACITVLDAEVTQHKRVAREALDSLRYDVDQDPDEYQDGALSVIDAALAVLPDPGDDSPSLIFRG